MYTHFQLLETFIKFFKCFSTAPEEFQSKLEDLKEQKAAAIERKKQEIREAQAKSVEKPSIESPLGTGNWPPRVN